MTKKVLIVCNEVGSAGALVNPAQKLIEDKKVDVDVICHGPAIGVFKSKGLQYHDLEYYRATEANIDDANNIFKREEPDLVFTGFSQPPFFLEKYLIQLSKLNNIRSVSILPGYSSSRKLVDGENKNEEFRFMPNYIFILDENARKEMVENGFNKESLIVTGQPFFDDLGRLRVEHNLEKTLEIKREIGVDANRYLVLFASQYLEDLAKTDPNLDFGYTEVTVIRDLYNGLRKLGRKDLAFLVKIHPSPREDIENTRRAIESPSSEHQIVFLRDKKTRAHTLASDLVTGMFATSLVEAAYLDKDVMSIQPGSIWGDQLPTNKIGVTVPVYRTENILPTLEKIMYNEDFRFRLRERRKSFVSDGKATERVVDFVYSLLL